jgi:hypothetical protein
MKQSSVFLLLAFISAPAGAGTDAFEEINMVMKEIAIKNFIINEDKKLPKNNRTKWETGLSGFIDFTSLNDGMRRRVREAIAASKVDWKDDGKTASALEEKGIIFLVPRELSDYTVAFLRAADGAEGIAKCGNIAKPQDKKKMILCEKSVSSKKSVVDLVTADESVSFVFTKEGNWRLSGIERAISEERLITLGNWK